MIKTIYVDGTSELEVYHLEKENEKGEVIEIEIRSSDPLDIASVNSVKLGKAEIADLIEQLSYYI
jgi:hypothetical protein